MPALTTPPVRISDMRLNVVFRKHKISLDNCIGTVVAEASQAGACKNAANRQVAAWVGALISLALVIGDFEVRFPKAHRIEARAINRTDRAHQEAATAAPPIAQNTTTSHGGVFHMNKR